MIHSVLIGSVVSVRFKIACVSNIVIDTIKIKDEYSIKVQVSEINSLIHRNCDSYETLVKWVYIGFLP